MAAVVLAVSLAPAVVGGAVSVAGAESGGSAASESEAVRQARASGSPVEVGALRGESREVFAQPDGTFEAVQHLRPVRTRQGGRWVDIDMTLHKRADGSVAPAASPVGIAFSGGGDGPMATMTHAGRRLSVSWPWVLPEPVLDGPVATYREVIPGVDLRLRADAEGFSDVLVVKTREAAADPRLSQLRLATAASGVVLRADPAGGLQAVDSGGGGLVFEAPQPVMWDSATDGAGARALADGDVEEGPEGSSRQAPVDVQVSGGAVMLGPDQAMLSDASTVFPVFIDPVFKTVGESANLMVANQGFKDYNFTGDEGMGLCPFSHTSECGSTDLVKRLFYRMPTSGFGGKTIISAEFQIRETFAPSCEAHSVELWKTKAFTSSSTWNSTSDNWLSLLNSQSVAKGFSGCPAGDVIFPATSAMREAAAGGWSTLTLGLRATTETCQLCWKRFDNDAFLRVHYDTPPSQPKISDLSMSPGGACVSPPGHEVNTFPKMTAILRDSDADDQLWAQFAVGWDHDGDGVVSEQWRSGNIGAKAPGSTFTLTVPSTIGLPQNQLAFWKVRAWDGFAWSPWSLDGNATGCYFTLDPSVPAAPTVTSTDYPASDPENPDDPWIDGVGRYGAFTIASTSTDVTRYQYQLNDGPLKNVNPASAGGPVTVQVMPTRAGVNFLRVQAFDAANNASAIGQYMFRVQAGAEAKATYALDEPADATQIKDTAGGNAATVHGGASLGVDGVTGTAMQLNGTDAYADTTGPLLDTTKSFAVSAWVNLASKAGVPVVVSQEGSVGSSFALYYQSSSDRWEFNMQTPNGGDWTLVVAQSKAAPLIGQWTHLMGVYDAVAKTISLYVNGIPQQTSDQPNVWGSSGPVNIGRYRDPSSVYGPQYYFNGAIDDLHVFDRIVADEEVKDLVAQRPLVAARWKLNDGGGTVRTPKAYWKLDDAAGSTTATDTQGAFPAATSGGVTFGTAGKSGTAMRLDAASHGYATTAGQVVDTTKSFSVSAWVNLTTKTGRPVAVAVEGSRNAVLAVFYSDFWDRWVLRTQTPDSDTPTQITIKSTTVPQAGTWTQLTGVYDATAQQVRLYVNGKLEATAPQPNTWAANGPVELGRMLAIGDYASSNFWTGALDDVRVFDTALTDSEAATLAGTGTGAITADDTTFGRHATLFAGAHIDQNAAWIGTGALSLNGNGDYAATTGPVIHTNQSFTIAAWVQTAGRPTRAAAVFSQEGNVNSGFTLRYAPDPADPVNNGGYQIDIPDADTTTATHQLADHNSFQSDGSGWDHVAIVYDAFADQMRLYVNGDLKQSEDGLVSYRNNTLAFDTLKAFQIGRTKTNSTYGEYWPGLIDDVWAIDGVVTEEQIAKLAAGVEHPTSNL